MAGSGAEPIPNLAVPSRIDWMLLGVYAGLTLMVHGPVALAAALAAVHPPGWFICLGVHNRCLSLGLGPIGDWGDLKARLYEELQCRVDTSTIEGMAFGRMRSAFVRRAWQALRLREVARIESLGAMHGLCDEDGFESESHYRLRRAVGRLNALLAILDRVGEAADRAIVATVRAILDALEMLRRAAAVALPPEPPARRDDIPLPHILAAGGQSLAFVPRP